MYGPVFFSRFFFACFPLAQHPALHPEPGALFPPEMDGRTHNVMGGGKMADGEMPKVGNAMKQRGQPMQMQCLVELI